MRGKMGEIAEIRLIIGGRLFGTRTSPFTRQLSQINGKVQSSTLVSRGEGESADGFSLRVGNE